jgi:acetolactate synthase-1/3 small subunit
METKKEHTILVLAQNKPGVLEKISMLLRRKMYNVEQITAGATHSSDISRITITFSGYDDDKVPLIANQIAKIVEVVDSYEVKPSSALVKELALVKLAARTSNGTEPDSELFTKIELFNGIQILEKTNDKYIVQIVGTSREIDSFISTVSHAAEVEVARTGSVALER